MTSGIISYGVYIPKFRIRLSDIRASWKKTEDIGKSLGIIEKAVSGFDEDAITMGFEASIRSLDMADILPTQIESVFFGSESHPYAVTPSATILAEHLSIGNNYFAADITFACKAATAGLQATLAMVDSGKINYGLVLGSDTAQAKPRDILEYTAASGSCAIIVGKKESDVVAEVLASSAYSSYTPDFWRREGEHYPSHFGRFTGEPAYFSHVVKEAQHLLEKTGLSPSDFAYCVFHMPNGKFPRAVAKKLGFAPEQLAASLTVEHVGNSYTASALIGLSAVLDIAKPKKKIFFVSYGSGAGSDGFIFETTENLPKKREKAIPVMEQIKSGKYVSYVEYLTKTHII